MKVIGVKREFLIEILRLLARVDWIESEENPYVQDPSGAEEAHNRLARIIKRNDLLAKRSAKGDL